MQLNNEIEQEKLRETLVLGPVMRSSPQHRTTKPAANWTPESRQHPPSGWTTDQRQAGSSNNWPTDSDNSLGNTKEN